MPLRDVDEQVSKGVLLTAMVTTREWGKASLARSHCGQWTRSRRWWERYWGLWVLVEQAVLCGRLQAVPGDVLWPRALWDAIGAVRWLFSGWSMAREVVRQPRMSVDENRLAEMYGNLWKSDVDTAGVPAVGTRWAALVSQRRTQSTHSSPGWLAMPSCALRPWRAQPSLGFPSRLLDRPSMCGREWVCDWPSPHSKPSAPLSLPLSPGNLEPACSWLRLPGHPCQARGLQCYPDRHSLLCPPQTFLAGSS